jgi:hypothetical protein
MRLHAGEGSDVHSEIKTNNWEVDELVRILPFSIKQFGGSNIAVHFLAGRGIFQKYLAGNFLITFWWEMEL